MDQKLPKMCHFPYLFFKFAIYANWELGYKNGKMRHFWYFLAHCVTIEHITERKYIFVAFCFYSTKAALKRF